MYNKKFDSNLIFLFWKSEYNIKYNKKNVEFFSTWEYKFKKKKEKKK
jgi:hypothetical protein